jgi:hypothetical protein
MKNIKGKLGDYFDFILQEQGVKENREFKVMIKNEDKSLGWWGHRLNGQGGDEYLKIKDMDKCQLNQADYGELDFDGIDLLKNTLQDLRVEGNELLSLNLQLNQLLMILNNPMLFPHFAYAKRFNEIINSLPENEK